MADNSLKRMKRSELIDIICLLQENEARLREENRQLKERLDERNIAIENAGSIAEASLVLTDIFNKAQEAADLYLSSVKKSNESKVEKE